ncbi:MAG TPA: RNA polymerase sigma factor [Thermoanaerobaculia bacterium]|nr:RNA polymerase sigma factor [Thermoanaerobaculia bacterium]
MTASGVPSHGRLSEPSRAALEAELGARFTGRLRLFAARRLGDATAAEDVAQAVLRRVVAALRTDRIRSLDALPAFVYQTARHLCLHRSRACGRERRALATLAAGPPPAATADALSGLIEAERAAVVRGALEQLPAADRELLRLLYYDLLEPVEAARRLGVSPGALRVRKHRALGRLAELLEELPSDLGNTSAGNGD